MERIEEEKILRQLEERNYPFPAFKYCIENDKLKILGKGATSLVYKVYNENNTDMYYALKIIGFEKKILSTEEFWKSVNIQSALCEESAHIVRCIAGIELYISLDEYGNVAEIKKESDGMDANNTIRLQFILMEKLEDIIAVDGLQRAKVRREELKDEKEILNLAVQIGQALLAAHKNNILHRDVKLENIFWDEREQCYKLGDFGISKLTGDGSAETIVFTDGYGAPEIKRRIGENYNQTVDIYSLGISLYLLLNNMKFPGANEYRFNWAQYNPEFVLPAPEKGSAPTVSIVRKMCSYWKEDRYQSIEEALIDLKIAARTVSTANKTALNKETEATETVLFEEDKINIDNKSEEQEDPPNHYKSADCTQSEYDEEISKEIYREDILKYSAGFALVCVLLFRGAQLDTSIVFNWQFWMLLAMASVEIVLLKIRELHITVGIAIILLGEYCMTAIGVNIPQLVLMLCVLLGIPEVLFAAVFATAIWMFLIQTGDLGWLAFIVDEDLTWIIVIALFAMLYGIIVVRDDSEQLGKAEAKVWRCICWLVPIFIIGAGLILQQSDVLQELHLIRVGVTLLILRMVGWWNTVV